MASLNNKINISNQKRFYIYLVIFIMAIILYFTPLFFHIGFALPFVYLGGYDIGNYIYDKFFIKEVKEVN